MSVNCLDQSTIYQCYKHLLEEFEGTKGPIRIRISKKNRQHNDQKKNYKMTNNDLQNIHIKLRSSNMNPTKTWGIYTILYLYVIQFNNYGSLDLCYKKLSVKNAMLLYQTNLIQYCIYM